jgi:L-iditol 2-dehydrogenase
MKAAYLIAPLQFEVQSIPLPMLPADGVLLKVEACGVCGSDLRRWKEGPIAGSKPLIAGHEIAGVVSAVGGRVKDYGPGERLAVAPDVHCGQCFYCERGLYNLCDQLQLIGITPGYDGGFAEYMLLTHEMLANGIVHRVPEGMQFQHAALAEPCSSVLAAHAQAETSLQDTVVVMGAGPIGCLHIAVARARGARVILSEPSPVRRELARAFQPELIIDPSSQDVVAVVKQATAGRGAEVAVCANPVAATQTQAVELVRKRGKVILFGGLPKANPMTSLDGNRIHYGEIRVMGTFSYHPSFHALALDSLQRGVLPADQLITHTFALDQIDTAFQTAAAGDALKVMVTF